MYNRYIPQPDGSFRRNRMPDSNPPPRPTPKPPEQVPPPCPEPPKELPKPPVPQPQRRCNHQQHRSRPLQPSRQEQPSGDTSVTGFLRRLLPKDFDTSDLLIVLLLLLMAGDSSDDQNTALLTLALYFFM